MEKLFAHFDALSTFYTKKLSVNDSNTSYKIGESGTETEGTPDILWEYVCFIKYEKLIWTHGLFYNDTEESSSAKYELSLDTDGILHCVKNSTEEGFQLNSDGSLQLA